MAGFSDFDRFENIVEIIEAHAAATPDVAAIVDGDRTITYSELYALVLRHAACLHELGLGPRDRVGLILKDHADHFILMIAAGAVGAASLSINWAGKIEEKRAVTEAFQVKLVFHDPDVRVPSGVTAVALDADWRRRVERAQPLQPVRTERQTPIKVMLTSGTSGTTGTPKGVEMTNESVIVMCQSFQASLDWSQHLRHLTASPLAFAGTYNFCMPLLVAGHTLELFPSVFSPEEYIEAARQWRVTSAVIVPTVLRRLAKIAPEGEVLLPDMRCLVCTGGPLSPEEKRFARERITPRFFEVYGASGCGPISVLPPEDIDRAADSVGRVSPLREMQVVDGHGRQVAANEIGSVRCRGPGAARQFCNVDVCTSGETFKDGWYYPGELGQLDDKGFLRLVGRTADVVIRGGVNIYPIEIEDTLRRHPAVIDAAVVGAPSREFGEEVVAFVCTSCPVPMGELQEICRRHLVAYKLPVEIIGVESFPKSAAGKVIKAELLRLYQSSRAARV